MSPFGPWLSTYGDGAVPARPWWRLRVIASTAEGTIHHRYERIDGATLDRERRFWDDGSLGWTIERRKQLAEWIGEAVAALDAYDDANPRPVPPPMCGQVWVFPNGQQEMITRVLPASGFSRAPLFPVDGDTGMWFNGEPWPVASTVLVSGPHAPWAPKEWRP